MKDWIRNVWSFKTETELSNSDSSAELWPNIIFGQTLGFVDLIDDNDDDDDILIKASIKTLFSYQDMD